MICQPSKTYRLDRWQETIALFAEMLERFPDTPYRAEGEYHIALCRRNLGDREEALAVLRGVVSAYPGTPWAGYAAERLKELTRAAVEVQPERPHTDERRPS